MHYSALRGIKPLFQQRGLFVKQNNSYVRYAVRTNLIIPARTPQSNHRHSTLCVDWVWSECGMDATIVMNELHLPLCLMKPKFSLDLYSNILSLTPALRINLG